MNSQTSSQEMPRGTVVADRFELEKLLGVGSMGSVYLAKDTLLGGQIVALKIVHHEYTQDEALLRRFMREVHLARLIAHPNVVRALDAGFDDHHVFFSMEYVEGESLERVSAGRPMPAARAAHIAMQVANGLQAIHGAGIIHRDLKPGNIMVLENDVAKIADFGVARPVDSKLTRNNEILGSVGYLAPEIWERGEISNSTDLYALGVTLFELLTGRAPYEAESQVETICLHVKAPVPSPSERVWTVPAWLDRLVVSLLQKRPEDRPQSAKEVVDALAQKR